MHLFKCMLCDRLLVGRLLPPNIKFIAACNPYRLRSPEEISEAASAGLDYRCVGRGARVWSHG